MEYQKIFDTHAHYDDDRFDEDRDAVLSALPGQGVCAVVNCGSNFLSSEKSIVLAGKYPFVFAAVGVHPQDAAGLFGEEDRQRLLALCRRDKVVAVGEIGLDYHYPHVKEIQLQWFEEQIKVALELALPVIVHDREAHGDTLALLRRYRPRGIVHCFSGSVEMMEEIVALGMYIGLGGAVTFRNAKTPVAVAAAAPADRLLLETDCPYMAPAPFRGKRCDSSLIVYTAEKIAEVRGVSVDEVLSQTAENARRVYGL